MNIFVGVTTPDDVGNKLSHTNTDCKDRPVVFSKLLHSYVLRCALVDLFSGFRKDYIRNSDLRSSSPFYPLELRSVALWSVYNYAVLELCPTQ